MSETNKKLSNVQLGMFIALAVASFAAGGVVFILDSAYGIGSAQVATPQASLMRLIVAGDALIGIIPKTSDNILSISF